MKEHPILFSTPMVKALLNGNKTMTRRSTGLDKINQCPDGYYFQSLVLHATGRYTFAPQGNYYPTNEDIIEVKCRYGKPGDLLWVRETWHPKRHNMPTGWHYEYKATAKKDGNPTDEPWKPSIHMPKAAARIWLRVTDVRLERLWEITEDNAKAEGAEYLLWRIINDPRPYVNGFASVWFAINGKASWNKNPWVWVVSFETLSANGKPFNT